MKHPNLSPSSAPFLVAAFAFAQLLVSPPNTSASLVAGWDFNSYDGSATNLAADFGPGTLDFSSFYPNTDNQTGTSLNALTGVSAETALALIGESHNGEFLTFHIVGTGLSDLVISYASKRSSTGFDSQTWAYSLDNSQFTDFATLGFTQDKVFELKTVNFSSVTALNNQPDVYFRLTLDGASSSSGNNRFDNIQILTSVPEAEITGVLAAAFLFALLMGEVAWARSRQN